MMYRPVGSPPLTIDFAGYPAGTGSCAATQLVGTGGGGTGGGGVVAAGVVDSSASGVAWPGRLAEPRAHIVPAAASSTAALAAAGSVQRSQRARRSARSTTS